MNSPLSWWIETTHFWPDPPQIRPRAVLVLLIQHSSPGQKQFDLGVSSQDVAIFLQGNIRDMGGSINGGIPKSSTLIRFSHINHPFWGTPILGNLHMCMYVQWIGLREDLNRKPWLLPSNWLGFPVKLPIIQFYDTCLKMQLFKHSCELCRV